MKTLNQLLLAAALLAFVACTEQTREDTRDLDETPVLTENQKREAGPKIKTLYRYRTNGVDTSGFLIEEEHFSPDGHLVKYIEYDFDGSGEVVETGEMEYNEAGHRIKRVIKADGETTTYQYSYSPEGKMTEENWSSDKGAKGKIEYEWNEGEIATEKHYKNGKLERTKRFEYEFDEAGNIVDEKEYVTKAGGDEKLAFHVSMEYDDAGKLVKENLHVNEGDSAYAFETYSYDERGNQVELREYMGDSLVFKEINEYNEFGEVVKDVSYEGNEMLYHNTYNYDEYGNQTGMRYEHADGSSWGDSVKVLFYE